MRKILVALALSAFVTATLSAEKPTGIPGLEKRPKNLQQAKSEADRLEKHYAGKPMPEAVKMFIAIVRGSHMGPGEGWFGPAQKRYDYAWLAKRYGVKGNGGISKKAFTGNENWFARLDRNKDGRILPEDLDWSDRSSYVQQSYLVNRLFRQIDRKGNGRITKEQWGQFFDKMAAEKGSIAPEDLRDALLSGVSGGFMPGDAPTTEMLLKGLFASEVGSLQEGPNVGETAPDFTLKTSDGKKTITLSKVIGSKPTVLVLGNFTCGPFRSFFPGVEDVYNRYNKEANFLMVYVREAHPTDGWRMRANDRVGVAVAQPTSNALRCEVAKQFESRLKPSMPLLVDEIDDRVGNAYSGMPARLYVIDAKGKVTYKSGRGPFGFKTSEMEQALIMTLIDNQLGLSR